MFVDNASSEGHLPGYIGKLHIPTNNTLSTGFNVEPCQVSTTDNRDSIPRHVLLAMPTVSENQFS